MAGGAGGKEVGRISIRVVPDLDRFWSDLKGRLEEVERSLEANVRVIPKMDEFREKVKAETEGMHADVKVKTNIDQSEFARTLAEAKAAAKAAGVKLDVGFRDHEAEARLASLIAKLKAEARLAHIELKIGAERSNTSRLAGIADGLGDVGQGVLGAGRVLRDNTVMIIVAVIALIAPALAMLAQALVALPALITAVALPLGTLALGFGGIKKALDDVGLLKLDQKFDKKGNPKGDAKQTLGGALKDIQQGVSDVFEHGLVPILRQMVPLLQPVGDGFKFIASGLIALFQGFADAVSTPRATEQIKGIFTSIGTMLTALAPGLQAFSSAMLTLIGGVSAHLPGLANTLNDWAIRFANWIDAMSAPGKGGGKSTLDKAVTNIKPVLEGVIHFLGSLLDAGLKLASNPAMAKNIQNTLQGITDFVVKGLPALAELFSMIAGLIDKLGKIPGGGILSIGSAPNLTGGGSPFDPNKGIGNFGAAWGVFKAAAGSAMAEVAIMFTNLWSSVSATAKGIFSGIWNGLVAAAQGAVAGVFGIFRGLGGQLQGIWAGVIDAAVSAWNRLVPAAAGVLANVVTAFIQGGLQIISTVRGWGGQIVAAVAGIAGQMYAAGAHIVSQFIAGLKSINIGGAVSAVLGGVMSLIPHSPAKEGPLSGSGWTSLFTGGQAVGQQFQDGLEQGFQGVIGAAKSLMKQVQDTINNGGPISPELAGNITQELEAIRKESDQLRVQRDALGKKDPQRKVLSDQLSQLSTARDQLKLQKDNAGAVDDTHQSMQDVNKDMDEAIKKMVGVGVDFGQANAKQFLSDIGASGNGAVEKIADTGIKWGTDMLDKLISGAFKGGHGGTTINVGNMDDALQAKQTLDHRQSLQYAGR